MNEDRRRYERWYIHIEALLYNNDAGTEAKCTVKDISENGISFMMPKTINCPFQQGDLIEFQFYDEFPFGRTMESFVITEQATIRHLGTEGDKWVLGCAVSSERFREYVLRREMLSYT